MKLVASGPCKKILLEGNPREQGIEHGRQARKEILANVDVIRRGMVALAAKGRSYDYDHVLSLNEAFVEREAPEVLEEIHGIAEGAGVSYHDLLLLNIPLYFMGRMLPLECSAVIVTPPATADGCTYLAKNRDSNGYLDQVVLHRKFNGGRELIEATHAGIVTWPGSGINSDGLAIASTGAWSKRMVINLERASCGWLFANTYLLLRDSRSVDDVAEQISSQPMVTGINIVATDHKKARAFEVTTDRVYCRDAKDGILVCTNHYLSSELCHLAATQEEYPSTYHRYQVATTRLRARHGLWDQQGILDLMSDHDGFPQESLCRHAQGSNSVNTLYTSIAKLPKGVFWTIQGNPCANVTSAAHLSE